MTPHGTRPETTASISRPQSPPLCCCCCTVESSRCIPLSSSSCTTCLFISYAPPPMLLLLHTVAAAAGRSYAEQGDCSSAKCAKQGEQNSCRRENIPKLWGLAFSSAASCFAKWMHTIIVLGWYGTQGKYLHCNKERIYSWKTNIVAKFTLLYLYMYAETKNDIIPKWS